jgi:acetoin:2,6-dichlorophenolindophenol oxidoreductase subunit beta
MGEVLTMLEALQRTIAEEMAENPDVVYMGIDVREGALRISKGLVDRFGAERVVNTPIAESLIVGMGLGAALMGLRPISELMFEDFSMLAMDHLYNNMGTVHYQTNGQFNVPLTVLVMSGTGHGMGDGAGHGQCLSPLFMSAPGISVCVPTTPADARGLLRTALRGADPVIFCVNTMLLTSAKGEVPDGDYATPLGKARVVRPGADVTLLAVGGMVAHAEAAAAVLADEGIEVEIIDPRTLSPLDRGAILESVAKTGRLVVAEESRGVCGVGAEVLAIVAAEDPSLLTVAARRLAAPMIPIPAAAQMEGWYLPSTDELIARVRELIV